MTSNLTVTAQWKRNSAGEEYTVVFVDGYSGNPPIKIQRVKYGEAAPAPTDPEREGYVFDGWDADFSYVTEPLTVIAQWKQSEIPPAPPTPTPTPTPKPVPVTGDSDHPALWLALMLLGLAGIAMAGTVALKRKK